MVAFVFMFENLDFPQVLTRIYKIPSEEMATEYRLGYTQLKCRLKSKIMSKRLSRWNVEIDGIYPSCVQYKYNT